MANQAGAQKQTAPVARFVDRLAAEAEVGDELGVAGLVEDVVKEGDVVRVKVLEVGRDGKIRLSMKASYVVIA